MAKKKSGRKKPGGSSRTRKKSTPKGHESRLLGPLASLPLLGWVESMGPDFGDQDGGQAPQEITSYHFT